MGSVSPLPPGPATGSARPLTSGAAAPRTGPGALAAYFVVGLLFGMLLIKTQVVSWFRIQEMFRFQSFYMYGILGSAVLVAAISVAVIRRLGLTSAEGRPIGVTPIPMTPRGTRYWAGGSVFGLGWALTGACPGPLFALVGGGVSVMLVGLAGAVGGAWLYGYLRPRLPH